MQIYKKYENLSAICNTGACFFFNAPLMKQGHSDGTNFLFLKVE